MVGTTGIAGCLGGGAGGDGATTTATEAGDGDGDATTTTESAKDFGGKEINVMLNVGSIFEVHKRHLIPRVEEKYNLKVNTSTGVTTSQLTKVQANPDNPPDVIIPDVIGIEKLNRKGFLEPLNDHTDIVTNLSDIHDKFVHYDSAGVSWEVGEVVPVINTNSWDSTPSSYDELMKDSEAVSLVPFAWSGGPYLLLMASAIATGEDFGSSGLDADAGFQYLEENLKPNVKNTYQGVSSAKQQLVSGTNDSILVFWDLYTYDMFLNDAPIKTVFRPDPTGIAFAECVAVPNGSQNMEAAMTYANEVLSPWFQERASEVIGSGVTNKKASLAAGAEQFGAATPDNFDQLTFPDFEYIWENRDAWGQRWSEIFSN